MHLERWVAMSKEVMSTRLACCRSVTLHTVPPSLGSTARSSLTSKLQLTTNNIIKRRQNVTLTVGLDFEQSRLTSIQFVNPEMRETLGFPFQKGRIIKPESAGELRPVLERAGT